MKILAAFLNFLSSLVASLFDVAWCGTLIVFTGSKISSLALLAAFMIMGKGVGGLLGGKFVDMAWSPLKIYGFLESSRAFAALLLPFAVELSRLLLSLMSYLLPDFLLPSLQVFFAIGIAFLISIFQGAIWPALAGLARSAPFSPVKHSRFNEAERSERKPASGFFLRYLDVSGFLGYSPGLILALFLLMKGISISGVSYLAAGTGLFLGLITVYFAGGKSTSRFHSGQRFAVTERKNRETDLADLDMTGRRHRIKEKREKIERLLVFGLFFLSSILFTCILCVVARTIFLSFGDSIFEVLILFSALTAGAGSGSLIAAVFLRQSERRLFPHVIIVLLSTALTGLIFSSLDRLPLLTVELYRKSGGDEGWFFFLKGLACFLLLLPSSLSIGAMRNLLLQSILPEPARTGRVTGAILFVSRTGIAAGLFAGVKLPVFSSSFSTAGPTVLSLLSVLVFVAVFFSTTTPPHRRVAGLVASGLVFLFLLLFMPFRDQSFMAGSVHQDIEVYAETGKDPGELMKDRHIIFSENSSAGSITVVELTEKQKSLKSFLRDGRVESSNGPVDVALATLLAHLPVILHGKARKVLAFPFSNGITAGAVLSHDGVYSLHVIEPVSHSIGGAKFFADENRNVLDDRRITVINQDLRTFLNWTPLEFDIIISCPPHPSSIGALSLLTAEFFELASRRLSDGGIMCQWLPLFRLEPRELTGLVATFQSKFPYVMLWKSGSDFHILLLGSKHPVVLKKKNLMAALQLPAIKRDFSVFSKGDFRTFASWFIMGPDEVNQLAMGGSTNTDDLPVVSINIPVARHRATLNDNIELLSKYWVPLDKYLAE